MCIVCMPLALEGMGPMCIVCMPLGSGGHGSNLYWVYASGLQGMGPMYCAYASGSGGHGSNVYCVYASGPWRAWVHHFRVSSIFSSPWCRSGLFHSVQATPLVPVMFCILSKHPPGTPNVLYSIQAPLDVDTTACTVKEVHVRSSINQASVLRGLVQQLLLW